MRKLSRRAKNRYMSQLIELSRRHNGYIRATNPAVSEMLGDDRGRAALDVLEALGLISIRRADNDMIYMITLTSDGLTYFERKSDNRRNLIVHNIAVPAIVSALTSVFTVHVLPHLWQLLKASLDLFLSWLRQWL